MAGEAAHKEFSEHWLTEAGKALVSGTVAGSIFGVVGAVIYSKHDGVLSCTGYGSSQYDGKSSLLYGTPFGCDKVVDLPVLGRASSMQSAAASYGLTLAVLVAVVTFVYLALNHD